MSKNNDQIDQKTVSVDTPKSRTKKHVIKLKNIKARPVLLYSSAFVMLLSLVSIGYYQPSSSDFSLANASATSDNGQSAQSANSVSVDEKLATDIAATFAVQTKMPVAANVANLSVSLQAQREMAQTDDSTVAKPQIVQPTSDSRSIISYKVQAGDSVASIAEKYGLQPDTIRWANNLSSDNIALNSELVVLPTDGILYTVKDSDTAASIAGKYKSTPERIVAYNDLEVSGIKKDAKIIIPGGVLPGNERPGYVAPQEQTLTAEVGGYGSYGGEVDSSPFAASYATSYPWGWCTYYAAARSGAPGNWGNANTWAYFASRTPGWTVSQRPVPGAIAQRGGGWGHVAIVDEVSADGTMIKYSDMNGLAGFGVVGHTQDWKPASSFQNYIYR